MEQRDLLEKNRIAGEIAPGCDLTAKWLRWVFVASVLALAVVVLVRAV
jgi:hypothetical protein